MVIPASALTMPILWLRVALGFYALGLLYALLSLNRRDGLFRKELLMRTAKNAGWLAGRFDFVVG